MSAKEIPKAWPSEAREFFTPVRALGTGGFGVVWLATRKQHNEADPSTSTAVNSSSTDSSPVDEYVAIKLVGHPSCNPINDFTKMSESGYFQRECEVLAEISHHRIVKLIRKIEQTEEERKQTPEASPYCMVLQYCRGPTVEQMLNHGGALGIHLAREVAAQLIDAISFLHGRGVIHRDIKPDNISKFLALRSADCCRLLHYCITRNFRHHIIHNTFFFSSHCRCEAGGPGGMLV